MSACELQVYHDRYRRTPDGWKFTERVYEVRYPLDLVRQAERFASLMATQSR